MAEAEAGNVTAAKVNNETGKITGELTQSGKPSKFSVTGPRPIPDAVEATLRKNVQELEFANASSNSLLSIILTFFPFILIGGILIWFNRQRSGQMNGIMNVGRSRAKGYTTDPPKTPFDDVAGYVAVKQDIPEVVVFPPTPARSPTTPPTARRRPSLLRLPAGSPSGRSAPTQRSRGRVD